jgi:uncharacterized protein YukE
MSGMDIEQVQRAIQQLRQQATQIESLARGIDTQVERLRPNWKGPDLDQFIQGWRGTERPSLKKLAQAIKDLADKLAQQREDQITASQAEGGASGGTGTGTGGGTGGGGGGGFSLPSFDDIKEGYQDFVAWLATVAEPLYPYLCGPGSIISEVFGFTWDAENGHFYTTEHSLQRYGGFMDFYDEAGPLLGMDLDTEVITYIYDGKEYRLQLWNGSYGTGAMYGGEVGLYYRDAADAATNPYVAGSPDSRFILYDCVEPGDEIRSVSDIYIVGQDDQPAIHNDTANYAEGEDHYWNLATKPGNVDKGDLYMHETLYFADPGAAQACAEALLQNPTISDVHVTADGQVEFYYQKP